MRNNILDINTKVEIERLKQRREDISYTPSQRNTLDVFDTLKDHIKRREREYRSILQQLIRDIRDIQEVATEINLDTKTKEDILKHATSEMLCIEKILSNNV